MLPRRFPILAGLLFVGFAAVTTPLAAQFDAQSPAAQPVITVAPQQCVWRAGDDPAWAAPSLDEFGWQPYASLKLDSSQPRIWIRCRLDPNSFSNLDHPAVQIRMSSAYEVFLSGVSIARNGDVANGNMTTNLIRVFPVPRATIGQASNVLALRIAHRYANSLGIGAVTPPVIQTGEEQLLWNDRAAFLVRDLPERSLLSVPLIVLGIIGLVLLGFSLPDRTRPEPILLAVSCILVGIIFVEYFCAAVMLNEPMWLYIVPWVLASTLNAGIQNAFYFVLAQKRMPLFYRLLIVAWAVPNFVLLIELLLPMPAALRLDGWLNVLVPAGQVAMALLGTAPFFAFWPWKRISPRTRALAGFCMAWGAIMVLFFAALPIASGIPKLPAFFDEFMSLLFPVQAIAELCVVAAIIALIQRDQQRTARERAMLAGEMQAARTVQQVIIPEAIPSAPGFAIESVYRPAGEVGGDFFQILPIATGGILIVIGDVSGKGMPAAMTVSLLVGTVRTLAHYTQSPGEILAAMNARMLGRQQGGFTTCLALRADPDGSLTVANAGHLEPYLDGSELPVESSLPLGLDEHASYLESSFHLPPSAQLTLISDGVVEARDHSGRLFGFDRTRQISAQPAEKIAQAAQSHGQEDDITVLTLTRLEPARKTASEGLLAQIPATA